MKIVVCDKWEIPLGQDTMTTKVVFSKNRPYFWFLAVRPGDVASEAWAIRYLCEKLQDDVYSVVDYFGGAGISSTIIFNTLRPDCYYLIDIDPVCVSHLEKLPIRDECGKFKVVCADSYPVMGDYDCDLVTLDFNSFTVLQVIRNNKLAHALRRVADNTPNYIIITDSAVNRLHLNLKHYSKLGYGEVTDLRSYLRMASEYMYDTFGYRLARAAWFQGATCCLYVPEDVEDFELIRVPKESKSCFRLEQ